jgi:hypothetical protein
MLDSARSKPAHTDGIRGSIGESPDHRVLRRYDAMADATMVLSAADAPPPRVRTGQRFYIGFGIFVILLSFAGFAPSLIDQSRRFGPPTTLLLVHGATALAWLLMYVTQALLVAGGRVALHRRLGWAGAVIAALVLLFGYLQIVDGAFRVSDLSGDFYRLMIEPGSPPFTEADYIAAFWGPLGQLVTFSLLVAAGIVFRRRPELHKRLMVFSLMPMAGMPVAHLSGALVGRVPLSRDALAVGWVVIAFAIYCIPAVHDKLTRGRIHRASIWIPLLIIVWSVVLNAVVAPSALAFKAGSWLLK